jgi:hypothetical protein
MSENAREENGPNIVSANQKFLLETVLYVMSWILGLSSNHYISSINLPPKWKNTSSATLFHTATQI